VSADGDSGFVVRDAVAPRRVLAVGRVFVGSGFSTTGSSFFDSSLVAVSVSVGFVVAVDGARRVEPRLVRGVVREAVVLGAATGFAGFGFVAVSSGDASGVGSGVGAAATSLGVGSGSGRRAPADETRFPVRLELTVGISFVEASSSSTSGPVAAAKEPPKNNW